MDATILSAPSSTTNRDGKRDPEMSLTQKNGDWPSGMKARIGVGAKSGFVHTVKTTTVSVHDCQVFTERLMVRNQQVSAGPFGSTTRSARTDVLWLEA